jgi:predicted membrane protein
LLIVRQFGRFPAGRSGAALESLSELKKKNSKDSTPAGGDSDGIMIRVKTIPDELMQIGPIHSLTVLFTDDINIPDELGKIRIDKLTVFGKISEEGKIRIRKMFPNTEVLINPY